MQSEDPGRGAARGYVLVKMVDERQKDTACPTFANHKAVLARSDVDAVVITTPDHWHAIIALDACNAKKDIYCEKPLTLFEARRLIDAVREQGMVFQTGSQHRIEYGHKFVTACELIRNRRIGKVLTVHVGVGDPPVWCDPPEEEMEPGLDWDRWLGPNKQRPYNTRGRSVPSGERFPARLRRRCRRAVGRGADGAVHRRGVDGAHLLPHP